MNAFTAFVTAGATIDGWLVAAAQFIQWIGPGCVVAAILAAGWSALDHLRDTIHARRALRHGIRRLEREANHPANRTRKEKP